MRVPLAWLRDYVELPADPLEVVTHFANLGFPVDEIVTRPAITGVVIGKLTNVAPHPNADRLQLCTVDIGAEKPLTIATAATNVATGQIVPVATIGAKLPKLTIEPRKMRGIDSEGMLVSAEEIDLEPEWFEDGIMQLDPGTPIGRNMIEYFRLDLPVLDVEVTTNRPDCLSLVGLARELSAALGVPLKFPDTSVLYGGDYVDDAGNVVEQSFDSMDVRVTLESVDVNRYVAQRVSRLRVRPAKTWMRLRLALAGQRPISNLVDISNFVMLELGQPLHFFDFEKIGGKHIIVRDARPGEHLVTLDGTDRELDPTALLIADDQQATGLAGLMGGQISEVSETTREIVIESANFNGPRVRRMASKLGMRTEASSRNEKSLPIGLADLGAARAARLLEQEGGIIHMPRGFGKSAGLPAVVDLNKSEIERLLGFTLGDAEIERALGALGFDVGSMLAGQLGDMLGVSGESLEHVKTFSVTVPAWRSDIQIPADLVEEIARVVGYDRLSEALPPVADQTIDTAPFDREMELATTLAGLGYHECITLGLQPIAVAERWRSAGIAVPDPVEITNPLSEDQRYLRFSLLPALLAHAERERVRPLRTFELGHVFAAGDPPAETNALVTLTTSTKVPGPAWRDAAFLAAKSDVLALLRRVTGREPSVARGTAAGLHPGKTAEISIHGVVAGWVGAVDPRLLRAHGIEDDAVASLILVDALPPKATRHFTALSKYPPIARDLAVILAPDVPAADVVAVAHAQPLVARVDVFDEYRGPQIGADKKSLALHVVLQRSDATLTDADADAAIGAIVAELGSRYGALLRQ
jgi:phenylalanyl-tRNA synthetase beta chain